MKRVLFALMVVVACKSKDKATNTGSGSAPPPPAFDAAVAMTVDAAPAIDAAAAPPDLTITADGVGPIAAKPKGASDDEMRESIAAALKPFPDLAVQFDVMETEGETEEGYFSVKKGDKEVLQIMRPAQENGDYEFHAMDPMFSTKDGIKPTDKASTLSKIADIKCVGMKDNKLGAITCTSAANPKLTFVINAENYKGKLTKKGDPIAIDKIADRAIFEIVR